MSMIAAIIGRICLAAIFIISGGQKILAPAGTADMLQSVNLSGALAMPAGIFELVAGLLLAVGLMTRLVAVLLAGFTLLATMFFHNQLADPVQGAMALKNLAIFGGLLMVFAYGQMRGSYDHIRARRKGEVAAHDAELRAARAEGRADAAKHRPVARDRVLDRDGDGHPG